MGENISWQAPQWLTCAYMEEVLREYLKDDTVHIQNMDLKPATGKGENYASVMSRIRITFDTASAKESQELSFIMKYSYESDPFIANVMNGYDVYNTEMKMYEQILPRLAEILKETGDTEKLFADTLKVDYERSTIIFEDLSVSDYVMADRKKGIDMTHARMVMRKLAKYHAAAAVLNERLKGALENFDHGLFNRHTRGIGSMFEHMTEEAANFAKDCPGLGQYYCDKLKQLSNNLVEYGIRAYTSRPQNFQTLCHGDLWINNMMMLYNNRPEQIETNLQNIVLIDFQFCSWSSPAVDLHYFFSTSLGPSLLVDADVMEKLVQYYHLVLSDMLRKLKYAGHIPTLRELRIQLEEGKFLAVTALLGSRAVMTTDQCCDDADFHSLVDDDEKAHNFRRKCYTNKQFQWILEKLLPRYDRCGLLDLQ